MTKSDHIRRLLAEHPSMPSREIANRTGVTVQLVATIRWKQNNLEHWRKTHLDYWRRSQRKCSGPIRSRRKSEVGNQKSEVEIQP